MIVMKQTYPAIGVVRYSAFADAAAAIDSIDTKHPVIFNDVPDEACKDTESLICTCKAREHRGMCKVLDV